MSNDKKKTKKNLYVVIGIGFLEHGIIEKV